MGHLGVYGLENYLHVKEFSSKGVANYIRLDALSRYSTLPTCISTFNVVYFYLFPYFELVVAPCYLKSYAGPNDYT